MTTTIGASVTKHDALDKVTGAAQYPADRGLTEPLTALVVFTDQPHARLVELDTSAAEAVDGLVMVLQAHDIPNNEYGLTMYDQPVLIGAGATNHSGVPSDISRWEGDQLCVIVAETPGAAQAAAEALRPTWEQLPRVNTIDEAMADGAPILHPEHGQEDNIYESYKFRKGDMAEGWAQAVAVVEDTYEVPYQEHAYLQPEAAVSYIDEAGRVTIEIAGQWTVEDQMQIAHALELPLDQIRVIYPAIGGAFGGREDMSFQIVLCAASLKLGDMGIHRPIRTQWSREESIVGHHKRHRGRAWAKWGTDAEGRIVAVEAEGWLDAGAYNYTSNKVLGNMHLTLAGPYRIPNARIDTHAVYTTNVPGGAFRGFGGPQGTFVSESQINKLAEKLGMDPVALRQINLLEDGEDSITQAPLPPGVSIKQVVADTAAAAGWGEPHPGGPGVRPFRSLPAREGATRHGRGFACAIKNVGFSFGFPERSDARIELYGDDEVERVILYHGAADVGQGAHTVLRQLAAEAIGIDVSLVEGVYSDTATTGDSGSASASRITWMAGNSVLQAAADAEKAWNQGDRPAVGEVRFEPPDTEPYDPDGGRSEPNFAYGYVAQAVDLSVDVETGYIRIDRVFSGVDVGNSLNPLLIEGQSEGAIVQAHGYALSENLQVDDGRILNPRLSQYLIPGIGDVPGEVHTIRIEVPDPLGPYGARGMAEMPFIPYAPAVVAALHDATGVWFTEFPLTPDRVRARLQAPRE